ncbi:S-adenosyl-L-methionine dependent methyltransferase [Laetiporus sulphureus 93-53]|uniref:S-adenosyl-L-methionine dependent methyltransferase n=1 Tax=Laetiporus sulphureus 93-53 TaxID=1314785 RepID=A0A165G1A8_9APHY|nr:S-adenosyl-L-methionine dependent methyltransferase [Laetiporus sulphureus 93-53]KZT09695.1 S-adenosyl-L-methionine dependent methyltransferase [Laetiporus sulphureus 93-53]
MHSRNPYRTPPDFTALAESYEPLKPYLITTAAGVTIDFKNDAAQRRLTEALLHRDFNISLTLPDDRLCPPVPNRLNYILWLHDVLEAMFLAEPERHVKTVRGVDIGTGASVIYPLLGCRSVPNWEFVATDIDEKSLQYARINVQQNHLDGRITIMKSNPSDPIFHCLEGDSHSEPFDFTMCNPPFYSSKEDVVRSAASKEFQPNAICTGADVEMITSGGESAFVRQMVRESLGCRARCRWFTSMLGKMSSLTEIIALLREQHIDNYACTEFVQGQTRRWAIAWSFGDVRLSDSLARIPTPAIQDLMPVRNTLQQPYPTATIEQLASTLSTTLASVEEISVRSLSPLNHSIAATDVVVTAVRDTWSRAARRKKPNADAMQSDAPVELSAALLCRVTCVEQNEARSKKRRDEGMFLEFNWVKGNNRALFESFTSHVGRKVSAGLACSD